MRMVWQAAKVQWAGALAFAVLCGAAAAWAPAAMGAGLPHGRAYEMVSAQDKNGGDVMGNVHRVRVAEDGSAVMYASLVNFGDAVGGGVATEYLSQRGPSGWSSHGVSPPQSALSFQAVTVGIEPRYQGETDASLSRGVVFGWKPLTDEPAVANVTNLYLRTDLRTPGRGTYELVTACPLCVRPLPVAQQPNVPRFVAGTPDLQHLVFETALNLAEGARGSAVKLYEWHRGRVALAGVLPSGAGALSSGAGGGNVTPGRSYAPNAISDDGEKVFFSAAPSNITQLYMRVNASSTVWVNRPETATPGATSAARYMDADESGSRVFFTSSQRLTDDAPVNGADKLYIYDTTKPDDDPHNLTYTGVIGAIGVVGVSADGNTIYFMSDVALTPEAPVLTYGVAMYAWHDGAISFVADLPGADRDGVTDEMPEWLGGKTAGVSASGSLAFLSSEPVGPDGYDHGVCKGNSTQACKQLYVYDAGSQRLRCASCHPDGVPGRHNVQTVSVDGEGGSVLTWHMNRFISEDGRFVFFTTADPLVQEDVNGKLDAYVYDTDAGSVALISSGRSTAASLFMETDPSGHNALFVTRERLVGWDQDENYDLYDARIGGGFPEPPVFQPACVGDGCRAPLTSAPALGATASRSAQSAGNFRERLKRHRGRVRCRHRSTRSRVRGEGKRRCAQRRKSTRADGRRRNR